MINIVLFFAILMNGLLAGTFFIWSNAITPGIGQLKDRSYLEAFQSMNRKILNPLFYVVFLAPAILSLFLSIWQVTIAFDLRFYLSGLSFIIYTIGVVVYTFLGNIPLNDELDHLELEKMTDQNVNRFRAYFETRWNDLHMVRTVTSTLSFVLLIVVALEAV